MSQVRTVSAGHTFLEGPRWHEGDLYVSEFFSREVYRFRNGEGPGEVIASVPGLPSGLGFLPDGDMLVVSMFEQTLYRLRDGELTPYADLRGLVTGIINDMLVDGDGRCYIGGVGHSDNDESDVGPTPLIIVQPDGEVSLTEEKFNFPNGIVKLSDGRVLVAETYGAAVRAFETDGRGLPAGPSTVWASWGKIPDYYDIDRAHVEVDLEPDGLALGPDDTVWVANAKGNGVGRYAEGGELVEFVETGDLSVYAPCEGGGRLFMCCAPVNRTTDWASNHDGELRVADLDR